MLTAEATAAAETAYIDLLFFFMCAHIMRENPDKVLTKSLLFRAYVRGTMDHGPFVHHVGKLIKNSAIDQLLKVPSRARCKRAETVRQCPRLAYGSCGIRCFSVPRPSEPTA